MKKSGIKREMGGSMKRIVALALLFSALHACDAVAPPDAGQRRWEPTWCFEDGGSCCYGYACHE